MGENLDSEIFPSLFDRTNTDLTPQGFNFEEILCGQLVCYFKYLLRPLKCELGLKLIELWFH